MLSSEQLSAAGSFRRDDSAEVDVYNPLKNEWDKIPSMNQVGWQRGPGVVHGAGRGLMLPA